MARTSRWLTGGTTRLIGTSLGAPGAGELPDSAMYWGGQPAGWPSGDLANYNKMKLLWGRKPDEVRLYSDNPFATTGITGSAGPYGLIQPDWRSIANDGAILVVTFRDGAKNKAQFQAITAGLNAVGSNAVKTRYLAAIQNLKRWRDDTGNTTSPKALKFGCVHEPTNGNANGDGTGPAFAAMVQACVNFFLDNGIGDGPKPSSGHGSTYSGTWYDMVEWIYVDVGFNMRTGQSPPFDYYPGDGFVKWVYFDIYAWGGGLAVGSGTAEDHASTGQVPQPGDTIVDSHYTDPWKSLQAVAGNPFSWYHAGPGGRRDVLLGLGEWATSEDVDTFTVSGGSLANPQTKTGSKYKKAEWFRGALAYFRGEAYTAPHSSANNVTVSTDGPLLIAPIYWNSQALAPRWWNTKPFNTGDTTAPTTSGADAHLSYDAMIDLVNDSIFSTSAVVHTPPVAVLSVTLTDGGTPEDWTFSATAGPGDSAIVSYAYGPGDGSGVVTHTTAALSDSLTHTYAATGSYTVTLTVTDANGLTSVKTRSLVVQPPVTGFSGALLIDTGDKVRAFRDTYNPSVLALESYAAVGGASNVVAAAGATETLVDPRLSRFQDITLSTNCTITMPTALAGMVAWVLVRQDGGGANTLAWTGVDLWPGGSAPVQTATASHADLYTFVCAVDGEWIGYRSAANLS